MNWNNLIAFIGVLLFQISEGTPSNNCQGNLIGWEREFYDTVIVGDKEVPLPPNHAVMYRLFILQLEPSCIVKVSALPAYIDEKTKDTSYSSSDGGFMYGTGFANNKDTLIEVGGKYNKLRYIRTTSDSSFEFEFKKQGDKYMEIGIKTIFERVNDAKVKELKSRWGVRY